MDTTDILHFLGWMTAINFGLLIFSTLILVLFKPAVIRAHQAFFDLDAQTLERMYFQYLAAFKILIVAFNLVPYLALRLMA